MSPAMTTIIDAPSLHARSTPMPEPVLAKVAAMMKAQGNLPRPPQAGRVIGIGAGKPS